MKIRTHMRGQASLESVAITDIILNMFIFFFTSFSLVYTFNPARESRVQVKLPQADVRAPAAPREPIEVTIDARGQSYLQGKPIAFGDLTAGVQALLAGDLSTVVIIRGDRSVVFDRVVQALEAVKKAGAERLSIAVEQKSAAPPPR
jgi:biopolymer transport protein ExbD